MKIREAIQILGIIGLIAEHDGVLAKESIQEAIDKAIEALKAEERNENQA